MFTAFAHLPERKPQIVDSVDALSELLTAQRETTVWVDLEQPDESHVSALRSLFALDEEPLDDCLHGEQRPRIDEYDGYLFLIVYGMIGVDDSAQSRPRKLAVFCGPRFLVTVHEEPIRTIARYRDRFPRHGSQLMRQGVNYLLYTIIDGIVDNYILTADQFEERIEQLEDASLAPDLDETLLAEAADIRRQLLELRRLAVALQELLLPLAKGEFDSVRQELGQGFQHVRDHLTQVIDNIDAQREFLHGVRDNYHAALAQRTNAVMKLLTVFAGVMMPLTVIAGVYGMNVPVWPPGESPLSFWGVLGVMGLLAGGLLAYFKSKKWL